MFRNQDLSLSIYQEKGKFEASSYLMSYDRVPRPIEVELPFEHLLHEVKQRSFKDTIGSSAELAVYNYKDSFKDIRLLQHLKRAGEMFEEQKWNSFSVRQSETWFRTSYKDYESSSCNHQVNLTAQE
ncbi:hypothetical protein ACET3Z_014779 [Daucus carota]